MARGRPLADRIVDAVLARADSGGWAHVRLHMVADDLGLSLADVRACFPDLDAVGDAWLARADDAMLRMREQPGFRDLPTRERVYEAMMAWFSALGGRRAVLRALLAYKLVPSHLHLQAALVVQTSRRVQWLREAAGLDAVGRRKEAEEIGLTALFVSAVPVWLGDRSASLDRTRRYLRRRLAAADRLLSLRRPGSPREGLSREKRRPRPGAPAPS